MYRLTDKKPLVLRQPPPPIRSHKRGTPMNGTHSSTLCKTKDEYNTEMYFLTDKKPLVLQQPPQIRPHKCGSPMNGTHLSTLCKTKEEYNTENCSNVAARTRPLFFRRCKRKMLKTINIESLPDHIVFEILVRVPAEDIYNATRFVCRKWCKIIHSHHFIHSHLQQSSCGLLAQFSQRYPIAFLASGKGGLIEKSKLNYFFTQDVLSSCNGLVLELYDNHQDLCVTNPITKQNFALPPFFCPTLCFGFAIAYAATSMEYKVIRPFYGPSFYEPCTLESQDDCVAILTVGVDKDWMRRVKTRHLSPVAKNLFLHQSPLNTDGFVHWAKNDSNSEYVLTLNVETEIISQFPAPCSFHRHDGGNELINYYYLPMGSYLSLLIARSKFSWEVWEMKPETGEWTKILNIDLEADQFAGYLNCFLVPGGWLKNREVLVFNLRKEDFLPNLSFASATPIFFAFNVCTRDIQTFELNGGLHHFLAHRNSLVWMGVEG